MEKEQKLVITGDMGAVCRSVLVWTHTGALVEGQCGVGKLPALMHRAARADRGGKLKDFDPLPTMPKRWPHDGPVHAVCLLLLTEALKDSELSIEQRDRIGIVMGTAMDGVTTVHRRKLRSTQSKRVVARPMTIGNVASAESRLLPGVHGPKVDAQRHARQAATPS